LNKRYYLNIDDNNGLRKIDDKSINDSKNIQNMSIRNTKRLKEIPKTSQFLDPCQVSFGDLYLDCDYEILWIAVWAT
jgi:hypothetical protein